MNGKRIFIRSTLTAVLPIILVWTFFETLRREIKSAFRYAWLDVRIDIEDYRREMRREDY
jgi:hypothetical protein